MMLTEDIHFRSMQVHDLPAVARLENTCQNVPWPMWCFRRMLRTHAACWILETGSELIGFGIVRMEDDRAHIMNMCVSPAWRHRGLGRRILLQLLSTARKKHARSAWLEVRKDNHDAILLYRKQGFRARLIRKHYYLTRRGRQHAIVMMRKVK
ncbi:MAG: ribosomal protein S18-alanine N-acetyltransferase [Thioalkalispiraceae bacterium]